MLRPTALALLASCATAFVPPVREHLPGLQPLNAALSAKEKAEQYWQGDWVCADCGYVYDRKIFGVALRSRRSALSARSAAARGGATRRWSATRSA